MTATPAAGPFGSPLGGVVAPARVALIGATGHGQWHRRVIADLEAAGTVELVALGDVAPVPDATVTVYADHRALLAEAAPEIVIVCTPPHTHAPIAEAALRAGADVLLEKPPALDLAEHHRLLVVVAETGRACQVGFQALASPALARLRSALDPTELTSIAAVGAWKRDEAYFRRASWVGRQAVNGQRVLDGALANPFAHAVMQVLAIAGRAPDRVEVERYRTSDIEVDDTATLRLTFPGGLVGLVAVTLCAEEFIAGEITVTGRSGTAVLEYPTDRLRLPGSPTMVEVPGRPGLLANLIAHRADPSVPLIAPLHATLVFTAVLEQVARAPVAPVAPGRLHTATDLPHPRRVVTGVNEALVAAGRRLALLSEIASLT